MPTSEPPDLDVTGRDADLAAAVAAHPGALVRFHPQPDSDLARAVGLNPEVEMGVALPLDALLLDEGDGGLAMNLLIVGVPPDQCRRSSRSVSVDVTLDGTPWWSGRATTVVIATGQFLRGLDLVPRGHPGDGRVEVQVYALKGRERGAMRARLATGTHVPHARIAQRSGARFEVRSAKPLPLEVDGEARSPVEHLTVQVVPAALQLLV